MKWLLELNTWTVIVRLTAAALLGGLVGIERGMSRHAAGFRTHMLVCVGAALAMVANQYIFTFLTAASDPARIGAQVVSGIGFLGAGTIIVTRKQQIRGLTTAAGLWASACMGICIGIGYVEAAAVGCGIILLIMTIMRKIDEYAYRHSRVMTVYLELTGAQALDALLGRFTQDKTRILGIDISKTETTHHGELGARIVLKSAASINHVTFIAELAKFDGVCYVEELQ